MKTAIALVALLGALTACGDDGAPSATPTASDPTPGSAATDYAYTLRVNCFCPGAGAPIRVTVRDGEVADAVHTRRGGEVEEWQRLTIADIVEEAEEARADGAAQVDVQWPEGQDHPDSVYIDQDRNTIDDEIGYEISNVTLQP